MGNAETWANKIPLPTYAVGDASAIKAVGESASVVSKGEWRLFNEIPRPN
jgi:dipeptidase E